MRIAILEDDVDIGKALKTWLEAAGHTVHHFVSGQAIVRESGRESFDLFLLDWQVPDLSGRQVLQWLRETAQITTPVLFATARDSEEDIVAVLRAGADDYMVKPVRRMELLARVEALLRRGGPRQPETPSMELGCYTIDIANRVVRMDGEKVEMTDKEFELTVFLFKNLGQLLSRGHITESVWGRSADVQSRTVDTHVSRLRKKLDFSIARGVRLTPIYNFGYRLEKVAPAAA